MPYIFVTGGAGSGKSRFALKYFEGKKDVTFIATGVITDPEMAIQIKRHKNGRPGSWNTIEEPFDLIKAVKSIEAGHKGVIIDCLSFWVSNLIYNKKFDREKIIDLAVNTAQHLSTIDKTCLIVTNEVGMGIIPHTKEGRYYRKVLGEVNQIFAGASKEVYFVVSGIGIKIK